MFKRGGNMLVPKDPKRISKSFDDDDENDDEDDVEELERKIRYKFYLLHVCELYGKIANSYFIVILHTNLSLGNGWERGNFLVF